eukprot:GHRQ01018523.1.p3 GENE.GHRQ01018523.1~~GHRQ01018523.1.p3  ORF type:complete len:130 (-),score=15.22 GHRQ01018523.1:291-680(-)
MQLLENNPKLAGQTKQKEATAMQMMPRVVCFVHNVIQVQFLQQHRTLNAHCVSAARALRLSLSLSTMHVGRLLPTEHVSGAKFRQSRSSGIRVYLTGTPGCSLWLAARHSVILHFWPFSMPCWHSPVRA